MNDAAHTIAEKLPLWQRWILVTAIGPTLVTSLPLKVGEDDIADLVAFGVVFLGQWLLLSPILPKASRWLWVSLIGASLALLIGIIPADRLQDTLDGIESSPMGLAGTVDGRTPLGYFLGALVAGAGFGAGLGLAQWLLLRWRFAQADWWIPANAAGYATGMVLQGVPWPGPDLLFLAPGITTAFLLDWLIKRPRPEAPDTQKRPLGVVLLAALAFLVSGLLLVASVVLIYSGLGEGGGPIVGGIVVMVLVLGIPSAAAGVGLLKRRNWARVTLLVLAANNLLGLGMTYSTLSAEMVLLWVAFHLWIIWYLCRPRIAWFFGKGPTTDHQAETIPTPTS